MWRHYTKYHFYKALKIGLSPTFDLTYVYPLSILEPSRSLWSSQHMCSLSKLVYYTSKNNQACNHRHFYDLYQTEVVKDITFECKLLITYKSRFKTSVVLNFRHFRPRSSPGHACRLTPHWVERGIDNSVDDLDYLISYNGGELLGLLIS